MDEQLPAPDADEGDDGDEVARQRRKHQPTSLNEPDPVLEPLEPIEDHAPGDPICSSLHPSSGPRRLRTVAQLEAMLLKE
jgi:hypothetical protein